MSGEVVAPCPLFASISADCVKQLLLSATIQVCLKKELLVGYGQVARELFVLMKGALHVSMPLRVRASSELSDTSSKVSSTSPRRSTTHKGGKMQFRAVERTGAITGLWNPYNRTLKYPYDVQATQQSTLLNISRAAVVEALSMYQDDRDRCIEVLEKEFTLVMDALKVGKAGRARAIEGTSPRSTDRETDGSDDSGKGPPTIGEVDAALTVVEEQLAQVSADSAAVNERMHLLNEIVLRVEGGAEADILAGADSSPKPSTMRAAVDAPPRSNARSKNADRVARRRDQVRRTSDDVKQQIEADATGTDAGAIASMVM